MSHCVVVGCSRHTQGDKSFIFPHALNEPEKLKIWIQRVNRKNWWPTESSRICSRHFVDGKPTNENPCPELEMGWDCPRQSDAKPDSRFSARLRTKKYIKKNIDVVQELDKKMKYSEEQIAKPIKRSIKKELRDFHDWEFDQLDLKKVKPAPRSAINIRNNKQPYVKLIGSEIFCIFFILGVKNYFF